MELVKQRIKEFHQRHGGECYSDGHFYFYANGAYRDVNPFGVLADPPDTRTSDGERQRAQNIFKFYRFKLAAAVREFDELNTRLAHLIPADEETELFKLKELQKKVNACKAELQKAQEALDATELGRRRINSRRAIEEERERIADFQKRRLSIRI
jgi:hypothetical protein